MRVIACLSPRRAYKSKHGINPKTGKSIIAFGISSYCMENWEPIDIPCGKCIECRLAYAREWANRCMMEALYHTDNWFVTLTYDDEHVPKAENGALTLVKNELSAFIKRLRKNTGQKIRYYGCGEYGEHTFRPHYHCIIFGLHLSDVTPWRRSNLGYPVYRSPTIERAWSLDGVPFGNCELGSVTWDSCCYVARYVQKKIGIEPEAYEKLGIVPEYVRMSRRPGIGYQYYIDHRSDIWSYEEINLAGEDGGISFKPPRYFDRILDGEAPEALKVIKDFRAKNRFDRVDMELLNTDLWYGRYMKLKEKTVKDRVKSLERKL